MTWLVRLGRGHRQRKRGEKFSRSDAVLQSFLRGIVRLLYHGITPVVVFDGPAPAIKRSELRKRKEREDKQVARYQAATRRLLQVQIQESLLAQARGDVEMKEAKVDEYAKEIEDELRILEEMQQERATRAQQCDTRDSQMYDSMIRDDEKTIEIVAKLRESRNREEYSDTLLQYFFHTQGKKKRRREIASDAPSWLLDVQQEVDSLPSSIEEWYRNPLITTTETEKGVIEYGAVESVECEEYFEDRKRERHSFEDDAGEEGIEHDFCEHIDENESEECGFDVTDILGDGEEEVRMQESKRKIPKTEHAFARISEREKDAEFSKEDFELLNVDGSRSYDVHVEQDNGNGVDAIDFHNVEKAIEGVGDIKSVECNEDECDDNEWDALFGEETVDDEDNIDQKQESKSKEDCSVDDPSSQDPTQDQLLRENASSVLSHPSVSAKDGEIDQVETENEITEKCPFVQDTPDENDRKREMELEPIVLHEDAREKVEENVHMATFSPSSGVSEWKTVFDECKLPDGKIDMDASVRKLREMDHAADAEKRKLQYAVDPHDREIVSECITILRILGVPYILSPGEADAQCGFLNANGVVDGIITDDSDVFLFGGTEVYRNVMSDKDGEHFSHEAITEEFRFSREHFILLGMLLGCDYCDGVDGVGAKTALQIIKHFGTVEAFQEFFQHVTTGSSHDSLMADAKRLVRSLAKRKKPLLFPSPFPNTTAYSAFLHPNVDTSLDRVRLGKIQPELLVAYASAKWEWDSDKTMNNSYHSPIKRHSVQRCVSVVFLQQVLSTSDFFVDTLRSTAM
eukprot:TRINITY_DN31195_c0_g1_i2.p1 TRINITY_DN31195_c0_g1~~TRINITY_DN31195_c0_g1_i2.p1  ORF type:complete len:802 (+),score=258.62 TRINITY_DN31195_c0_g1_i2:245-2650(+)